MTQRFDTPGCPATLAPGFITYSRPALKHLFNGRKVFHVTEGDIQNSAWKEAEMLPESETGLLNYRMKLTGNKLLPDPEGNYLLSTPDPHRTHMTRFPLEVPANRHLCMQLASQVFDIDTAPNGLYFFSNGHPAHLVKINPDAVSFGKFLDPTLENNFSCMDLMALVDKHAAANIVGRERLFIQVMFYWLIGDHSNAPGKYSFIATPRGDLGIAPVHNAVSIRLHQMGSEIGAPGGLYANDRNTPEFHENGHYTYNEFFSFANRAGISAKRYEGIISSFQKMKSRVEYLTSLSFLPAPAKDIFLKNFNERLARL